MAIGTDKRRAYTDPAVGVGHPTNPNHIFLRGDEALHVDGQVKADKIGIVPNCRLDWASATVLRLSRYRGKRIPCIDASGNVYFLEVPAAGVDLSNSGLTATTTYLITWKDDGAGVPVLEAFSIGAGNTIGTHSATGLPILNSDSTRIIAGVWYTNGTPQFVQNNSIHCYGKSYWNRRKMLLSSPVSISSTSTTWATGQQIDVVNFGEADDFHEFYATGALYVSTPTAMDTAFDLNGASVGGTGTIAGESQVSPDAANEKLPIASRRVLSGAELGLGFGRVDFVHLTGGGTLTSERARLWHLTEG